MIRRLEERDVEAVLELGSAMHAESVYAGCEFDLVKLAQLADVILRGAPIGAPEGLACFVAESDHPDHHGQLVGMFVATCQPMWFGNDRIAGDLAFYVTPARRGGAAALLLVKQFEAWARGPAEARWLAPGISTRVDVERTREFFHRLGYRPWGERFLKEIL